ncbi:MAG: amidohydrolase family protein, partial [Chloroflexi bacterium]|nr:amidohydrolase family protein [Chloroflexota bacterium]
MPLREVVERCHRVPVLEQTLGHHATDVSGRAGHENRHGIVEANRCKRPRTEQARESVLSMSVAAHRNDPPPGRSVMHEAQVRGRRAPRHRIVGLTLLAAVACTVASAGCAGGSPEPSAASSAVVYDGARLVDGTGTPAIDAARLVIDDGAVAAVGPQDEVESPPGATVVDLTGRTVMPALVNLHGHVGFQRGLTYDAANYTRENIVDHLNRYAYYGVGVIVSLGTDAGDAWSEIRRDQEAGTLGGARLFTAGRGLARPNAGPGAAALRPSAYGVTSQEEGRRQVQRLAAQGVAFVKIWVDDRGGSVEKLEPDLYRAIIDEAHGHGLDVIAHVFYHDDAEELVAAGVDGFAHLVRDREMDDALVAAIVENDVFVMPNIGISERGRHTAPPPWLATPILTETVAPAVLARATDTFASRAADAAERAARSYEQMERSLAKLHAAGAELVLGSDSGVQDHFYGFSAHRELELMVVAGLNPMDAIATATSRSADRLGLDDSGRLTPGARADFIVLDANPLDD